MHEFTRSLLAFVPAAGALLLTGRVALTQSSVRSDENDANAAALGGKQVNAKGWCVAYVKRA